MIMEGCGSQLVSAGSKHVRMSDSDVMIRSVLVLIWERLREGASVSL